jgi:ferredoxin-type protein NapH
MPGEKTPSLSGRVLSFVRNRRTIQSVSLVVSNAWFFSFLRFIPCGYLQCSNCAASTFTCPLILLERGAVMASMGVFGGAMGTAMAEKVLTPALGAMAMLVLFGALFGSWGCGWLCPFGFFQDLLAKIPLKKFHLPSWSGVLRIPVLLGLVVAVPYLTRTMFFCDVCPSGAITRLWQQAAGIPLFLKAPEGYLAVASLVFLACVIVLSLFTLRPFCTLLCPIGGVVGVMNKVSGVRLAVDREHCVACGRCAQSCPQGIDPSESPDHSQCSRCLECTDSCKFISVDLR